MLAKVGGYSDGVLPLGEGLTCCLNWAPGDGLVYSRPQWMLQVSNAQYSSLWRFRNLTLPKDSSYVGRSPLMKLRGLTEAILTY